MAGAGMSLEQLKARMTEEQRRDMAEIVAAEVKRREGMKLGNGGTRPAAKSGVRSSRMSKGLPAEGLGEVYGDIQDQVKQLRMQQLDEKIAATKKLSRSVPRSSGTKGMALFSGRNLMILGIVVLGLAKIAFSSSGEKKPVAAPAPTVVNEAAIEAAPPAAFSMEASPASARPIALPAVAGTWTPAEKQVLTELDARRVELEKRRQELDQREEDIKNQAQALSERLAELKTLTNRVSQVRKERDNQYEARLEQLANVYGSMAPDEAAPLVGKLEEDTALALLKRMPGKRMGQILSAMDPDRAVELTRVLSDKEKLDIDLPAVPR